MEMDRKIIALLVLVIALIGIVYNIERTARPASYRAAAQAEGGHED
jgi:hypothetical protein